MNYFNNKALIDKAYHKKTAYKIQFYNNKKVDEFVQKFNDAGVSSKPSKAVMSAELGILNKPEVYKNYNRILNSPYTSNDNFFKLMVKNKASNSLDNIVKSEVERISKNLDYVEQVLKKYTIPTEEYNKLVTKQAEKSLANRRELLEKVAIKNNEILASEGLNIPSNVFSYRDIETSAQSLLRESQMTSKYEEITAVNDEYLSNGKDAPYTHKQWIWTGEGATTRHESNHLQKVRFDEPFIVVNDKTLDIDEMMYPCDPAGSPSNAYICYCEIDYLIGEDDEYGDNLGIGTILDNAGVFSETVPVTPVAPEVTFLPNIKGLFEESKSTAEPLDIKSLESGMIPNEYLVPKDLEGIETVGYEPNSEGVMHKVVTEDAINEYNKQFETTTEPVTESKGSYIDVSKYDSAEFTYDKEDNSYLIDYKLLTKNELTGKWELNGLEMDKEYSAFVEVSKEKLDAHNNQFIENKTRIGEEMNLPETETTDTLTGEVETKKAEPIDTSLLEELDSESWHINHYNENIKADLEYNETGDYWEYKGLKVEGSEKDNPGGWIDKDVIEAHNKQFAETEKHTEPVETNTNEKIDTTGFYYSEYYKQYTIFDHNGIKDVNGKKIYKGLDVTPYYNYADGWADIPKQVIDDYNNGKTTIAENTGITKKIIFEDEVIHSSEDGGYLIETFKLDKIGDKYYYKGLEVKITEEGNMYQLIPEKEFKNHNKQFQTEETSDDKYAFKQIVETREYVHNKKSNILEYGKDIDGQSYAVDKRNGKQYILDERAKYEKRQDALQNQVDMSKEYNAVNDWGGSGYRKINHFNYNKGTFEGDTYHNLRDEIHPVLNQIRQKLSKGESIEALEKKFNNIKNKYINEGLISASDRVFRIIDEIKDIDTAMVKAPELQQDTCFIRAGAWKLDFNKIGEIFEWEGFAGITYNNRPVNLGHDSLAYNITILAPKGIKGVRLSKQFDGLVGEREWLLPRGQKFHVLEFDEDAHTCTIELIIDESWS